MPNTGAVSCGTGTNEVISGSDWINPGNITASDDSRSTAALTGSASLRFTQYLIASNFGFSIPSGATIDGILVEIERSATTTSGSPRDLIVQLTDDAASTGLAGDNKADTATTWPTTDAYASYGGASDTWAFSPTDSIINASGFGVLIRAQKTSGETSTTVRVDHVRITVYYTAGASGPAIPVVMNQYRQRRN